MKKSTQLDVSCFSHSVTQCDPVCVGGRGGGRGEWGRGVYVRERQSILKEISPEYSLEGLMLKLKLQYSGHLI